MTIENTYNIVVFLKSHSQSLYCFEEKKKDIKFNLKIIFTHIYVLMNEEGEKEEEEKIIWTII